MGPPCQRKRATEDARLRHIPYEQGAHDNGAEDVANAGGAAMVMQPQQPFPGRNAKNPARRGQKLRKSAFFAAIRRENQSMSKTRLQEAPGRGVIAI